MLHWVAMFFTNPVKTNPGPNSIVAIPDDFTEANTCSTDGDHKTGLITCSGSKDSAISGVCTYFISFFIIIIFFKFQFADN